MNDKHAKDDWTPLWLPASRFLCIWELISRRMSDTLPSPLPKVMTSVEQENQEN